MTDIGSVVELKIESLAYRGAGVARHDGLVYFVRGTCPGETVLARVVRRRKRFAEAVVESILQASEHRIDPCCRVKDSLGEERQVPGCVYDHLAYPAEVEAKQLQYLDFLSRQAGIEDAAEKMAVPFASPRDLHYRNKIVLHSGQTETGVSLGYKMPGTGRILEIPACPLAVPEINQELAKLRESRRLREFVEGRADVTFRWTEYDGTVMWAGLPPRSTRMLRQETAIGSLDVPLAGFAQVNPAVAMALTQSIMSLLREEKPVQLIDLYCGSGIFALAAAHAGVAHISGIETDQLAVKAAQGNARRAGFKADFLRCPAAKGLHEIEAGFEGESGAVIVDPPRQGLDTATLEALLRLRPALLLYISCAPDVLARDLKRLIGEGGYELVSGELFDMFPRTAHFETLNVLKL